MGAIQSLVNSMIMKLGIGGEDPKDKPSKKVYTSQDQITKDNSTLRNLLFRQGAPSFLANNSVVARKVGDPIPQYEYPNGRPSNIDRPVLQTTLPMGVSINDIFQTKEGRYGYMHPQEGNFIQVEPNAIFSKYKK